MYRVDQHDLGMVRTHRDLEVSGRVVSHIYMERLARLELIRTDLLPLEVSCPVSGPRHGSAQDASRLTNGSKALIKIFVSAISIRK